MPPMTLCLIDFAESTEIRALQLSQMEGVVLEGIFRSAPHFGQNKFTGLAPYFLYRPHQALTKGAAFWRFDITLKKLILRHLCIRNHNPPVRGIINQPFSSACSVITSPVTSSIQQCSGVVGCTLYIRLIA